LFLPSSIGAKEQLSASRAENAASQSAVSPVSQSDEIAITFGDFDATRGFGSLPQAPETWTSMQAQAPVQNSRVLQRRQRQRLRRKTGRSHQLAEKNLQHTGVSPDDKYEDVIPSALRGFCKNMLARQWARLQTEMKDQVLIWNSLPRWTTTGGADIGVMVKGSDEEYMHDTIKVIVNVASADPILAAKTMECALQQPGWNGTKLSSATVRAIWSVLKAKCCIEYLQTLPERVLSTGRTAVTSMKDRSFLETGEINALIAGSFLEGEDLRRVRQAFLIPELAAAGRTSKHHEAGTWKEASPTNQPRPPLKGVELTSVKVRVKNAFLEVDVDSADNDDTQSLHIRSSAATSSAVHSIRST